MSAESAVRIILVEDDAGHARLIEKNLRRAGVSNEVKVFGDGQEAVDYLCGAGGGEGPLLVLLDLNLPGLDGYQVLKRLKSDEEKRQIPVVMLTTTDSPEEVGRCYELGCNAYITKPVEYERFSEVIRNLGHFLSIVKVPEA